jgi:hypothetical protein
MLYCAGDQWVQKSVLLQREEKGFGFRLSGSCPAQVQSVRESACIITLSYSVVTSSVTCLFAVVSAIVDMVVVVCFTDSAAARAGVVPYDKIFKVTLRLNCFLCQQNLVVFE